MNVVEYCPEQPYELWYPISPASMFNEGKMNITRESISFDRHGAIKYAVRTSPEGYTYLELDDVPSKTRLKSYLLLRYVKYPFTFANHSCMLTIFECSTKEQVEAAIQEIDQDSEAVLTRDLCDGESSYVRNADRGRMVGLIPPDIYE